MHGGMEQGRTAVFRQANVMTRGGTMFVVVSEPHLGCRAIKVK